MLVHVLGGPRWSFTVHGPEEFDKAPLIGLRGEGAALRVRGGDQLLRPQPALPPGGARALAQGAGRALRPRARVSRRARAARRRRRGGSCAWAGLRAEGPAAAGRGRAAARRARRGLRAGAGRRRRDARRHRGADRARIARRQVRITGWISSGDGARGDPGRARAGAAELRRGPAGGDHGGDGAAAPGDQHLRRRHPGAGARRASTAGWCRPATSRPWPRPCRPASTRLWTALRAWARPRTPACWRGMMWIRRRSGWWVCFSSRPEPSKCCDKLPASQDLPSQSFRPAPTCSEHRQYARTHARWSASAAHSFWHFHSIRRHTQGRSLFSQSPAEPPVGSPMEP